jgi:hypothetical protein
MHAVAPNLHIHEPLLAMRISGHSLPWSSHRRFTPSPWPRARFPRPRPSRGTQPCGATCSTPPPPHLQRQLRPLFFSFRYFPGHPRPSASPCGSPINLATKQAPRCSTGWPRDPSVRRQETTCSRFPRSVCSNQQAHGAAVRGTVPQPLACALNRPGRDCVLSARSPPTTRGAPNHHAENQTSTCRHRRRER